MEGIWTWSKDQLLSELKTNEHHGLTWEEARARLRRNGTNELRASEGPSKLVLLLRQFRSPLIYILVIAGLFAIWERSWTDVLVIYLVVFGNAIIGYFQEYRAEKTMAKLRHILSPKAKVIRGGQEQKIDAKYLVVGDLIMLGAGDRVPADARLITAQNLRANQASLTGESIPANKRVGVHDSETALMDRDNIAYNSTLVVDGQAVAVVIATGMNTELGKIAKEVTSLADKPERLEQKIAIFSQNILIFVLVLAALIYALGIIKGVAPSEMIKMTLALLVSLVPEGLPVIITLALSVGLVRVYRRQAVIRKLAAVETLGSVTTICVDKTGTLTHAQMMVERIFTGSREYLVTGEGYRLSGHFLLDSEHVDVMKQTAIRLTLELSSLATMSTISKHDLTNDEAKQLADPTETALAVVAAKAGFYAFKEEKKRPEILEIPFDQTARFSASVHGFGGRNRYIVKGAPEKILSLSTNYINSDGRSQKLLGSTRHELEERASHYARDGYRVVALGMVDQPRGAALSPSHIKNLTFVAYLAIEDPVRQDVARAIKIAQEAGVRVMMVTGDHLLTAQTVAERVGLLGAGKVIDAEELTKVSLGEVSVIARSDPQEKLVLVGRLQKSGEVVAMTGDGVNDAPALKRADIGIAMGRGGTDVAIEAADMVLLTDSFSGIVAAIEQGRLIWENLRKVIFYLISTAFAESMITVMSLLTGSPLPLLPVQIIWLNLVTDGINALPLTIEPAEKNLMKRPPRPVRSPLVDYSTYARTLLLALVMMAVSFALFRAYLDRGVDYARTVAMLSMFFFQVFQVFNSRSATQSVFRQSLRSNPSIWLGFAISTGLTILAVYLPALRSLFHTASIDLNTLLIVIASALSVIVVDELRKLVSRLMIAWAKTQTTWS